MRNNFELIEPLLEFTEPNTFYFVQILKRRKENPEMKANTSVIDNFYLYTQDDLAKLMPRIIEQCEKNNARAYINLNRLDLENIALYVVKQTMDCIINKDFKSVKNVYQSACGSHFSEKDKKWIIDIDEDELHHKDEVVSIIEKLHAEIPKKDYKILAEIPTKTGIHLIVNPFNVAKFMHIMSVRELTKIERKDNSPTVLYIGDGLILK